MQNAINIEVTERAAKSCRSCNSIITLVKSKAGKWYAVDVYVDHGALVYRKVKGKSGYYAPWHTCANDEVKPSAPVTPAQVARDLELHEAQRTARGFSLVSEDGCFSCTCGALVYARKRMVGPSQVVSHYNVTFNSNCDAMIDTRDSGVHICPIKINEAIDVVVSLVKTETSPNQARVYGHALGRYASILEGGAR